MMWKIITFVLSLALANAATKPNIIFILTDDQDARMNSLDYMQGVQEHLVGIIL